MHSLLPCLQLLAFVGGIQLQVLKEESTEKLLILVGFDGHDNWVEYFIGVVEHAPNNDRVELPSSTM